MPQLYTCIQLDAPAPQALVQLYRRAKYTPISDMCFRILDLRSAIQNGQIDDQRLINEAASEIDRDLQAWPESLPQTWSYEVVDKDDRSSTHYEGRRHIYANDWTVQSWNNWRTLRIMANQIIMHNEHHGGASRNRQSSAAIDQIHQMSRDICTSASGFMDSSRMEIFFNYGVSTDTASI